MNCANVKSLTQGCYVKLKSALRQEQLANRCLLKVNVDINVDSDFTDE